MKATYNSYCVADLVNLNMVEAQASHFLTDAFSDGAFVTQDAFQANECAGEVDE
tara:strand:+ start:114 stop:275 length:162 start_codon:yes stop_codon:yes gene_type:complete